MGKRTYTDADREQVRAALALNGGDVRKTARQTGIPRTTVITWRDKPKPEGIDALPPAVVEAAVEQIRQDKRGEIIALAWDLAADALRQSLVALPRASAQAAAIVAGIAIDKAQLLMGEATSRAEVRGSVTHDVDLDNIAAILSVLEEVGVIPAPPATDGDPETLRLLSA